MSGARSYRERPGNEELKSGETFTRATPPGAPLPHPTRLSFMTSTMIRSSDTIADAVQPRGDRRVYRRLFSPRAAGRIVFRGLLSLRTDLYLASNSWATCTSLVFVAGNSAGREELSTFRCSAVPAAAPAVCLSGVQGRFLRT